MDEEMLKYQFPTKINSIIKVVGVGGGGGNAANHMFNQNIEDVTFAVCNTDAQALIKSPIGIKVQLGQGLGAGNRPKKAEDAALESEAAIKKMLSDGTQMVFITAGMGGGTGTGAAPVVASIAKNMNILTVGIVTIPFLFEGRNKIYQALKGVEKMSRNVDALLVINNQRILNEFPDLTLPEAFAKADETLSVAAKGIAEIVTKEGHINLDFADVCTTLKDSGVAIMSTGYATGENRLEKAIDAALNSPLLNNNNVKEAKRLLFCIYTAEVTPLIVRELTFFNEFTGGFDKDVEVIWGESRDNSLEEGVVKITLLAAGYGMSSVPGIEDHYAELTESEREKEEERLLAEEEERKAIHRLAEDFYGNEVMKDLETGAIYIKPAPYILSTEELDNDKIIEALEYTPAFQRNADFKPKEFKMPKPESNQLTFD